MMTLTGLVRAAAVAATLSVASFAAMPAVAAPADVALLKEYVGSWKGRGTVTGANTETIVCRLSMEEGNQDKVNYNGRCTLAGTTLSIRGTVAFINGRFEAAMSSNVAFTGVAIGRKRGDSIVFDLKERQKDDEGNDMDVTARMTLAGGRIDVGFQVVFAETGDMMKASVPFTK